MSLPQTNATLLDVSSGGASEDYNTPAGAGTPVWTGAAQAYYQEKRERTFGESSDVLLRRKLIVETSLRDWKEGETVTFEQDGTTGTGKVQMIERSSLAGVGDVATTTLTLETQ